MGDNRHRESDTIVERTIAGPGGEIDEDAAVALNMSSRRQGAGPAEQASFLRRVVPHQPIHRFPDEVGVAVVAGVLLDHVEQDGADAG